METNYFANIVIALNQLGYIAGWDVRLAVWLFGSVCITIFIFAFISSK